MSNYNKATNFAVKDTLTSGDPDKVVSGAEIDNEFNGISAAITSKADKVASATTDNLAALDANGNLKDSSESVSSIISQAALPTGTVTTFVATTVPSGWLECDGSNISRSTFSDLFEVMGTAFGAGDGTSTFGLPDLRGEFVRGWDNGRGIDSGRSFGSFQQDQFESHNHNAYNQLGSASGNIRGARDTEFNTAESTGRGTSSTGGDETRPRNVALMYIIKT